jgi:hypothetical protein
MLAFFRLWCYSMGTAVAMGLRLLAGLKLFNVHMPRLQGSRSQWGSACLQG